MNLRSLVAALVPSVILASAGASALHVDGFAVAQTDTQANPIRRVVTMLQKMAEKVQAEGEKEQDLYEKFMCYCTTNGAELAQSISDNQAQAPQTQSDIEAGEAEAKQLKIDLKSHHEDRSAAKQAMETATAQREKEHASYLEESGEYKTYVEALARAIPAIMKGMGGGFLQAASASLQHQLQRAVSSSSSATEYDRQTVMAFLGGRSKDGYIPVSGEITGILKEIKADFEKNLADVDVAEADAAKLHVELIAAKTKQVQALSDSLEKKTSRIGELEVEIVKMKNDLTAAEAALLEDQKFAAELGKGCDTKKGEWEERQKIRSDELVAIHDTIKILNDDDSLDLLKKTLDGPSLLQMDTSAQQFQRRALAKLPSQTDRPRMDFLALALAGKKVDFTKVHKMIDDMVGLLAQEQQDDDSKREYCDKQIDQIEDKGKELKKKVEDLEVEISNAEELISTYTADIKAFEKGIVALDKSVAEATDNRKTSHDEFTELMSSNTAAKQLLEYAKNRLHKFYSPSLYKGPAKKELTQEDKIYQSVTEPSFMQLATHHRAAISAPDAPPGTWNGGYAKKSEDTSGVISMLDLLVRDLTKEMTVAETDEQNAQNDYEGLMQNAAKKRAADLKVIQAKQTAKAVAEEAKTAADQSAGEESKQLMATQQYEMQLHQECDWLQQNHQIRKEARAQEMDALKEAKAILSGADFALLQRVVVQRRLRG